MNQEQTKELAQVYNSGTKGMWVSIKQGDTYSIVCNEHMIAKEITETDAHLIDVMHEHFSSLLNSINNANLETTRLARTIMDLNLDLAAAKREAEHWHTLYNAAREAGEKIIQEIK